MLSAIEIIVLIVVALFVGIMVVFFATGIKIVPQSSCYVIERLGVYKKVWDAGIHLKFPIIDRIAKKISLKEQVVNFKPQTVITKDNVTMSIDTVLYYLVTDSKLYCYGVQNPILAIDNLTATTLRNAIGDLELDKTLTSRDYVNSILQTTLDAATTAWGIKVVRVEVKNILPPSDVRNAMEKQMKAEREKRALILRAEGIKQSQILEAEGKAKALLVQQQALSDSVKILNDAKPTKEALVLRSFDTMVKVSNSSSSKIIIPSELQKISGLFATAQAIFTENPDSDENIFNIKPSSKN